MITNIIDINFNYHITRITKQDIYLKNIYK